MSDFDDLIHDMDQAVADTFGDAALLNPGGHSIQVVIEKGSVQVGIEQWINRITASIPQPPVDLDMGQEIQILESGDTYKLREELEDDGYMAVWVVS